MSNNTTSFSIQPYLFFNGRCEEAIEFYRAALGAKVEMLKRFKENPDPKQCEAMKPGTENKIMHATLIFGDTTIMMSDGRCGGISKFDGFTLSIKLSDQAQAEKFFNALAEGGNVQMPLSKTFYSPCFGMLTDRFDVGWMILVQ